MTTRIAAAALVVLAFGAASAMARGPEISDRVGASAKGTGGTETRDSAPTYQLTGQAPAQPLADEPAAAPATQPAVKYVCPMGDYTGDKPGNCPKCGMKLQKKTVEAKPGDAHQQ